MKKMIVVLSLAMLAAACGGDERAAPEASPSPEAPSPEATTPAPEAGATVEVAESELGTILVDAEGQTLYVFLNDSGGESSCYGECAANWPALETEGEPQSGADVDASLLGTTEHEDGSVQVTYNEWPLYHFAADEAPRDTNGQAVGEVWYVVSPDGEPIRT